MTPRCESCKHCASHFHPAAELEIPAIRADVQFFPRLFGYKEIPARKYERPEWTRWICTRFPRHENVEPAHYCGEYEEKK